MLTLRTGAAAQGTREEGVPDQLCLSKADHGEDLVEDWHQGRRQELLHQLEDEAKEPEPAR